MIPEVPVSGRLTVTDCEQSCLVEACNEGHPEVVRELLKDKRVDPLFCNGLAFRRACGRGQLDCVKELLKDARMKVSYIGEAYETAK